MYIKLEKSDWYNRKKAMHQLYSLKSHIYQKAVIQDAGNNNIFTVFCVASIYVQHMKLSECVHGYFKIIYDHLDTQPSFTLLLLNYGIHKMIK